MQRSIVTSSSIRDFTSKYEEHLLEVRGLSRATGAVHRQLVPKLFRYRFQWPDHLEGFSLQRLCWFSDAGIRVSLIAKLKKCG